MLTTLTSILIVFALVNTPGNLSLNRRDVFFAFYFCAKFFAYIFNIFFNIKKLVDKNVIRRLKKLEAIGCGIYGSCANGTNHEESDIDIWIKVDKHPGEAKVATVSNEIRKLLGRNVQILVLTPERIERLKKEDPIFYYSLVFGSIRLYGEGIE